MGRQWRQSRSEVMAKFFTAWMQYKAPLYAAEIRNTALSGRHSVRNDRMHLAEDKSEIWVEGELRVRFGGEDLHFFAAA